MSLVYEGVGRLVVGLILRRYRDQVRLIGIAGLVAVLFAVLWGLRGSVAEDSARASGNLSGLRTRRKRRAGSFLSIR